MEDKYKIGETIWTINCWGVFTSYNMNFCLTIDELLKMGATPVDSELDTKHSTGKTETYKCPSYVGDDNKVHDCTCGKCGESGIDDSIDVRYEEDVIQAFNKFIKKWCGKWYPHLIDDDENDGQFMREKIMALGQPKEEKIEKLPEDYKFLMWCDSNKMHERIINTINSCVESINKLNKE